MKNKFKGTGKAPQENKVSDKKAKDTITWLSVLHPLITSKQYTLHSPVNGLTPPPIKRRKIWEGFS